MHAGAVDDKAEEGDASHVEHDLVLDFGREVLVVNLLHRQREAEAHLWRIGKEGMGVRKSEHAPQNKT